MTAPATAPRPSPAHHRLIQAARYADSVLDAVTPHMLSRSTPCRAWNLRMLLEHAHESLAALYEGVTARQVAARPAPADAASSASALVSGFRQRAAALLRASAQAGDDTLICVDGYPMPLESLLTTGALEIAVHAWDISQACGQCLPIPEESATDLLMQARLLVPPVGRHPLFAEPVPVPPRSTTSDRLTAYLGRPGR